MCSPTGAIRLSWKTYCTITTINLTLRWKHGPSHEISLGSINFQATESVNGATIMPQSGDITNRSGGRRSVRGFTPGTGVLRGQHSASEMIAEPHVADPQRWQGQIRYLKIERRDYLLNWTGWWRNAMVVKAFLFMFAHVPEEITALYNACYCPFLLYVELMKSTCIRPVTRNAETISDTDLIHVLSTVRKAAEILPEKVSTCTC